jgi:hypothetical protein
VEYRVPVSNLLLPGNSISKPVPLSIPELPT